jgi:hypothetical protein
LRKQCHPQYLPAMSRKRHTIGSDREAFILASKIYTEETSRRFQGDSAPVWFCFAIYGVRSITYQTKKQQVWFIDCTAHNKFSLQSIAKIVSWDVISFYTASMMAAPQRLKQSIAFILQVNNIWRRQAVGSRRLDTAVILHIYVQRARSLTQSHYSVYDRLHFRESTLQCKTNLLTSIVVSFHTASMMARTARARAELELHQRIDGSPMSVRLIRAANFYSLRSLLRAEPNRS